MRLCLTKSTLLVVLIFSFEHMIAFLDCRMNPYVDGLLHTYVRIHRVEQPYKANRASSPRLHVK